MKTIGEIFKQKRTLKNITIADAERTTKIRKSYIEALEAGNYNKLPPAAFTRGFVKNYSEFLGLPTSEILALYRREFDEQNDKRLLPKSVSESVYENIFTLTPKRITYASVFLLFFIFTFYIVFQFLKLSGAPTLIVQNPGDNVVYTKKELEVIGKTDIDAVVKINGQEILNKEGNFFQNISLNDGLNTIEIEAVGKNGKSTKTERHIRLMEQ